MIFVTRSPWLRWIVAVRGVLCVTNLSDAARATGMMVRGTLETS